MKIGRINYLNTAPFFHFWPSDGFEQVPGSPRELAQMAKQGLVDAGPLPLVESWALEDHFIPLKNWGIAAKEKSGSVFVLSRKPLADLQGATIGITQDTSTSVMLLSLLLKVRYGLQTRMKRGLDVSDDAWLVIGDQALSLRLHCDRDQWPYVTDLATEWWHWQKKPFVFARWVARTSLCVGDHARLEWLLSESLDKGLSQLNVVADSVAQAAGFPAELVEHYLSDLIFQLDEDAIASAALFRQLIEQNGLKAGLKESETREHARS